MNVRLMEDNFSEEEFKAVDDCLRSGKYTQGEIVESFEKEFAEWNGSKYAVMVNSGSSANLLMVYLLTLKYGLKEGDEVLVPAVTWPTTVYPIIQNGLVPVFCDVDESFNIDIESIKRMKTAKTKAVFVVHLLGQPAVIDKIRSFCKDNGLILIEDCCESLGAKVAGKKVGTFGVMSSFSFYFAHHMTTIEGGMITTDDYDTFDLLKSARSHGWVRDSNRIDRYPEYNDKSFLFDMLGYNVRSTNVNAAIGRVQLKRVDEFLKTRIGNHKYFLDKAALLDIGIQIVNIEETSAFCFAMLCLSKEEKEYLLSCLREKGIEVRPVVGGNLLRQPVFKDAGYIADKTPMADRIDDCGFYFANNHMMNQEKLDYVFDSIKICLDTFRK